MPLTTLSPPAEILNDRPFLAENGLRILMLGNPAFSVAVKGIYDFLNHLKSVGTLEAMLADAYRACIGRPVIDSELSREEFDKWTKTAQDLSSESFLSLHRPEGEITPMKALKIAADVFIHQLSINFKQQMEVSARVDQGIITDVRGNFQDFTQFKGKMVGSPLSEWK